MVWRTTVFFPTRFELCVSRGGEEGTVRIEPFRSIQASHGYTVENLPTGAIIAKGTLDECLQVSANYGTTARLEDGRLVQGNVERADPRKGSARIVVLSALRPAIGEELERLGRRKRLRSRLLCQ